MACAKILTRRGQIPQPHQALSKQVDLLKKRKKKIDKINEDTVPPKIQKPLTLHPQPALTNLLVSATNHIWKGKRAQRPSQESLLLSASQVLYIKKKK